MDRQTRRWAGCGLMIVLAASGCRGTRPEVPPGRPYSGDGREVPPVEFSSAPHPSGVNAMGAAPGQYGVPAPAAPNYGMPTGNAYGPPGQAPPGAGTGTATAPLFSEPSAAPPPAAATPADPLGGVAQPGPLPGSP